MALVHCAECNYLVSNKTYFCPNCGYVPKGNCKNCQFFENAYNSNHGRCTATENEYVREDKSVCPAVLKKSFFTIFNTDD